MWSSRPTAVIIRWGADYRLEFDLLIPDSAPAATQIVSLNLYHDSGALAFMTFHTTNMKVKLYSYGASPTSKEFLNVWSKDEVMHVVLGVDADGDSLVAWINGALLGGIDLASEPEYHGVKRIAFGHGNGAVATEWAVDNVYTSNESVAYYGEIPLWDVSFSEDDPNSIPAVGAAAAGVVNTLPTDVSADAGCSLLVQDSFTAGGGGFER